MQILNYFYFIIISFWGLNLLFHKYVKMRSPFDARKNLAFEGTEAFWVLTFSTGLLALSAPGTIDLMAVRLLVLEVFCLIGLFLAKQKPILSISAILCILYIIWLLIGMAYSPTPIYGLRVIMKNIYPLLIILFASAIVRNQEVFMKAGLGARTVAIISVCIFFIPGASHLFPGVFWYGTASAIHYISICIFSLALFYSTPYKKKNLLLTVLFILPCILWVFRTSIMGTTMALTVFFFFKYKAKSLPVIFGLLLIFIIAIFTIPSIKEKMFYNKTGKDVQQLRSGNISMDDINSNGRFAMWKWSLNKFYHNKEFIGSGTGNLQEVFYSQRHPFGVRICHNDYVQILCDNGLIGLILFGGSMLALIVHCFGAYQNKKYTIAIRICAITTGASAAGTLLTLYTDNVINYTMATLSYPCGFYGMMLGLIAAYKKKEKNAV